MPKAVKFHRFGEPAEVLEVEDQPRSEPGANEVLIRMRARPVNPSDLLTVRGLYGVLPDLPATPGLEGMGEIEATGANVTHLQKSARVIPLGVAGTWQEFLIVPAAQILPVPDAVSDETAAQFVVNPLTAWAMIEELKIEKGEWLLQTAAGSTLGRIVLQLARELGFRTINVVRRGEQAEELKQLGADETISTDEESITARVREITGGRSVRAAMDAVGGKTGGDAARALGRGGVMLVYGLLSGEPLQVDAGQMIFNETTVRGFWLSEWFRRTPPAEAQKTMTELLGLMATGRIVPPVEAQYDLTNVREAVVHAERPGRSGKVLLVG
jgi:NADPH:quinone reductase